MENLNIIEGLGIVVATIATILAGMYFILKNAFNNGIENKTFTNLVNTVEELPCIDNGRDIQNHSERLSVAEKHLEKLPCKENLEHIHSIEKKLALLESNNNLLSSIKELLEKGSYQQEVAIGSIAVKNSPLKMTPIGEIIYEKIKAKKTIENNIDFFISELEQLSPKTAYDVETKTVTLLYGLINKKAFDELKNFLYVSPEVITIKDTEDNDVNVRISMSMAITLMGIKISEEYLKRNPKILESIHQMSI